MRELSPWLSLLVFAAACSGNGLPSSPTAASSAPSLAGLPPSTPQPGPVSAGPREGWPPWIWGGWLPGGEPLDPNATIDAVVQANDVCVPTLRAVWDARASCKRFLVSVPSEGRLTAFLRWDVSAPGFNPIMAGDVVLVAKDGRFVGSDWQKAEVDLSAPVSPGDYSVLVMTYESVTLPFQLKMQLR